MLGCVAVFTTQQRDAALGPFQVTRVLGEGGSGIVYAARWRGRDVALKLPRDPDADMTRERQRFLDEARRLAGIDHPGIASVLDVGTLDDGRPYLAMELLRGETLASRIERRGALPLDLALEWFAGLAEATSALHDAGLFHRDLKGSNVFVVDGGALKLLDFGIAKDRTAAASTTTQAGHARGTPATMAPERFFGAAASESTEVYELALLLYFMLAGRLPWSEAPDVEVRLNPVSLRAVRQDVPEPISTEIMRALSTRPERRPPDVRALRDRLLAAAAAHAPQTPPRTTQQIVTRPAAEATPRAASGTLTSAGEGHVGGTGLLRSRRVMVGLAVAAVAATILAVVRARVGSAGTADAQGAQIVASSEPSAPLPASETVGLPAVTAAAAPTPDARDDRRAQPNQRDADTPRRGAASHPPTRGTARETAVSGAPLSAPPAELPGGVYEKPPYP
jgi:serine/threonine-protein kinase